MNWILFFSIITDPSQVFGQRNISEAPKPPIVQSTIIEGFSSEDLCTAAGKKVAVEKSRREIGRHVDFTCVQRN